LRKENTKSRSHQKERNKKQQRRENRTLKKVGKRKNTKTQNGRRRKISRDRNKTTTNPFKDGRGERRKTSLVAQAVMKQNRRKKDLSLSPSLSQPKHQAAPEED
jgi:hypothetical protein